MDSPPAGGAAGEQRVAWAELFFDLIWVFAVTQIATALAAAPGPGAAARTLLLFVPLWWGWVGTTMLANLAGGRIDRATGRMVLFATAGCGLLISVAVSGAYGDRGLLFAAGYAVLRLILWMARSRLAGPDSGLRLEPFAVSAFLVSPLLLLGAFLQLPARVAVWAAAIAVELVTPRLLRARQARLRFETAHLPERFGLFLIIALGETVVAVGGRAAELAPAGPTLGALVVAFALIVLLWWTYFHYGAPAVRHSLEHDPSQARIVTDVFSYAHLGYVLGIILTAVGLKKLIGHPLDRPHTLPELLLAPGVAVYLTMFCYARWRMFGAATVQRILAALACAVVAVAAPLLPALVIAALITLVLLALNGYEGWLVRTGRPLPLVGRPRRRTPAAPPGTTQPG